MKQHIYLFIAGVIALASCTKQLPATVEYPMFSYANTQTIRITKVERTDSSTVLSVHAEYIPHYWIKIVPETCLVAGNDSYGLVGADGIVPGELFWMPDSGEADFTLSFEPLGPDVRKVDFIEGDEPGAYRVYDIDLTTNGKAVMPKCSSKIGQPSLTSGQTTVIVDASFRRELVGENVRIYVNNIFPAEGIDYNAKVGEDGIARFSFWQNGPAAVYLSNFSCEVIVNPGEKITVHPEGSQWRRGMAYQPCKAEGGKFTSLYRPESLEEFILNGYAGEFVKEGITGSGLMAAVREAYSAKRQELEEADLPAYDKEYLGLHLKGDVCNAITFMPAILKYNYQESHGGSLEGFEPITYRDEDLAWLADLGLDDTRIYLANGCSEMFRGKTAELIFGDADNFHTQYAKAYELFGKVRKGHALDGDDMALMESFTYPMFKDGIEHMQKEMEEAAANMPENVRQAPDVPDAEMLDAILARYAGKTVMVDIWATWCGPCRHGHEELEPLKDTDYSDVQFVYLTSPTSPRAKWVEMVRGIRGDHYYLTEDQLGTIFTQLESNAYPTYLIVGKDGSRKGRFMGYDADAIRKAIESAR